MNQAAMKRRHLKQNPTRVPDLHSELLEALTAAQEERARRDTISGRGEPEWVAYERSVMIDTTIAQLIRHELPIDADEATRAVTDAERRAQGHSDYSSKWAVGCAEYVTKVAAAKLSGKGGRP